MSMECFRLVIKPLSLVIRADCTVLLACLVLLFMMCLDCGIYLKLCASHIRWLELLILLISHGMLELIRPTVLAVDHSSERMYQQPKVWTLCGNVRQPESHSHVHSDAAFWSLRRCLFLLTRLLLFITFKGLLDVFKLHPPHLACS